jgi:CIC family chloride channel protein
MTGTAATAAPGRPDAARAAGRAAEWAGRAAAWVRAGRGGMFLLALVVGAVSGLGAVAFRYLVNFVTWLATGHAEFGQQGRVPSAHLLWLGLGSSSSFRRSAGCCTGR